MNSSSKALDVTSLLLIKSLFDIDRVAIKLSEEDRLDLRQRIAKPKVLMLKKWLDESKPHVVPKTKLGEAITYTLNRWKGLLVYLEYPYVEISNAFQQSVSGTSINLNATGTGAIQQNASGLLNFVVQTGQLLLNGGTFTATDGNIVLANLDTIDGSIKLGANTTLNAASSTGTVTVSVYLGSSPSSVPGFSPGNLTVVLSNGGNVFFGNNSILSNFPVNTITASAGTVRFDTGGLPAAAITMDGNVQINLAGTPLPAPDSGGGQSSSLASSSGSNTPADNNADSIPKLGFTPPNANANPDGTIAPTDKTPPLGFSGNVAGDLLAMAGGSGPGLFGGDGAGGASGGASGGIGGMGAGLGGSGGFMSLADVGLSDSDVDSGSRLGSSNTPFVLQYDCTGRPTMRDDGPLIDALQSAFDGGGLNGASLPSPFPSTAGSRVSPRSKGTPSNAIPKQLEPHVVTITDGDGKQWAPSKELVQQVRTIIAGLPKEVQQFLIDNGYTVQVRSMAADQDMMGSAMYHSDSDKAINFNEFVYSKVRSSDGTMFEWGNATSYDKAGFNLFESQSQTRHEVGHALKLEDERAVRAAYLEDLNNLRYSKPGTESWAAQMKKALNFQDGRGDARSPFTNLDSGLLETAAQLVANWVQTTR